MIYKTRAIIVKRTNFGEADRIVTVFSENLGKLKIVAKGIRKIKSKLSGNLELFCLSNLNIAEGRNLDIVTGALIEKCYFNIRNNLEATRRAYYFSELIEKLTEEKDPHSKIFNLLDLCLENLNKTSLAILISYFEWNITSEIGYHPELVNCVKCRKKATESEKIYFNINRGGIICNDCQTGDIIISSETIKILRLMLTHSIISLQKLKLDNKMIKDIQKITRAYLTSKSEKDFKSQRFLS